MNTNAFIISILIFTAILLFKTVATIATPCSENTNGEVLLPPQLEVAFCDFKISDSSSVNLKQNCSGNLSIFLLTCSFNLFVSTPYSSAKSLSSIT